MFKRPLEQIAKKMFQDFAMRRTGMWLDWRYLSAERKLAWIKEVAETITECLLIIEEDLLPPPHPVSPYGAGGYERGFRDGQDREWNRLKLRVEAMKEQVEKQLIDFIDKEAERES